MQEYLASLDITVEKSCGRLMLKGKDRLPYGNIILKVESDGTINLETPWEEVIGTIRNGNIVGVDGKELNKSDLITIHPSDRETNRQKPIGQPSVEQEQTSGFLSLIQRIRRKFGN